MNFSVLFLSQHILALMMDKKIIMKAGGLGSVGSGYSFSYMTFCLKNKNVLWQCWLAFLVKVVIVIFRSEARNRRKKSLFAGLLRTAWWVVQWVSAQYRELEERQEVLEMFFSFSSECIILITMPRNGTVLSLLLQALYISCCDYSSHIQYRQPQNLFILV